MDSVTFHIQHKHEWEIDSRYVNYDVDVVVISFDCDLKIYLLMFLHNFG